MNAKEKHALWRGNWVESDGYTLPAYIREVSNGKIQTIIQVPNKSGWRLFVMGNEVLSHKSLFQVLRRANEEGGMGDSMKTLDQAFEAANKGPVSVDNHLMIVAADGDYLAKIDASEGKKWRASAALLVHGFNHLQGTEKVLRQALEVIRDCQMPPYYHRTKGEVVAEIEQQIATLNKVEEIRA